MAFGVKKPVYILTSHETFSGAEDFTCWGAPTKRQFKYGKELSPRGLECECTQEERSTSITKQLVFPYPRVSIDLPISITFGFVPKGYRKSVPRN